MLHKVSRLHETVRKGSKFQCQALYKEELCPLPASRLCQIRDRSCWGAIWRHATEKETDLRSFSVFQCLQDVQGFSFVNVMQTLVFEFKILCQLDCTAIFPHLQSASACTNSLLQELDKIFTEMGFPEEPWRDDKVVNTTFAKGEISLNLVDLMEFLVCMLEAGAVWRTGGTLSGCREGVEAACCDAITLPCNHPLMQTQCKHKPVTVRTPGTGSCGSTSKTQECEDRRGCFCTSPKTRHTLDHLSDPKVPCLECSLQ